MFFQSMMMREEDPTLVHFEFINMGHFSGWGRGYLNRPINSTMDTSVLSRSVESLALLLGYYMQIR